MVLKPHHDVHPWRQRIGLIALAVVMIAGGALLWNHRVAADMIQRTVNQWMMDGAPAPAYEERGGRVVNTTANAADDSDAADPAPAP